MPTGQPTNDRAMLSASRPPARHGRQQQRSPVRNLWAFLQIVGHVLAPWRRRWRLRWGATDDERGRRLPGDDLVPNPIWEYTHGISIAAPAERVWPWIAQIGQGRGGFYTFELLENIFGCCITNADDVLPEHQQPAVGDQIRLHPDSPPLHVALVETARSLVLRGAPVDDREPDTVNLWAFHLLEDERPGHCRLVERGRSVYGTSFTDRLFFSTLLVEPIGFVMSREMLRGIKERAETRG